MLANLFLQMSEFASAEQNADHVFFEVHVFPTGCNFRFGFHFSTFTAIVAFVFLVLLLIICFCGYQLSKNLKKYVVSIDSDVVIENQSVNRQ